MTMTFRSFMRKLDGKETMFDRSGFPPRIYRSHVELVLAGDVGRLKHSFTWSYTSQGFAYWSQRCDGEVPLSDYDKALLKAFIEEID